MEWKKNNFVFEETKTELTSAKTKKTVFNRFQNFALQIQKV
jgi:hypothetical protein